MSKYMKRWISMTLISCLLLAGSPAALMEDAAIPAEAIVEVAEPVGDAAEAPAQDAPEAEEVPVGLAEEIAAEPVDDIPVSEEAEVDFADAAFIADGADEAVEPEETVAEAEEAAFGAELTEEAGLILEDAPEKPYFYAWTVNAESAVYRDEALTDAIYTLFAGEAVLVTERREGVVRAAITTAEGDLMGYMAASDVTALDAGETDYLMDLLAAMGNVSLYEGDIDWPLSPEAHRQSLAAADFTRQSNDKQFTINGKTFTAHMVGDHSDCWSWANALYKMLWGVKFTNKFIGDPVTGHSLIRNLSDEERLLTGENLRRFMKQSVPGCTLRIASCPSTCPNINIDSCPRHEKHSLIVVEIGDDGFVVMDNVTGNGTDRYDTRYYTYDNFAKHWARYKMVKYIKWPNAPEFDRTRDSGVKPESVSLSESSMYIRVEDSQEISATVLPENAEDKSLTWSSSDPFVAYMGTDGKLVAASAGTATLTATTVNGINATMEVNVVPRDVKATKITLEQKGTVYVTLGSTLQLNAIQQPSYANPDLKWKSSKKKVATVSATGLVTPKKVGVTTITVVTPSKKTAKVKVKVTKGTEVGKVTLDKTGTVTLNMGETLKLNAALSPDTAKASLKWKSSKKKVAVVSADGTVTPKKAGTTTIAVKAGKKTARVRVKVVDANAPGKVTLNQTGTVKLSVGETLQLTPALTPETARTTYAWKSSKKKVASVSADGLVTAKKKGAATIAVKTANGLTARVKVKVVAASKTEADGDQAGSVRPTAVTLNQTGAVTVKVGETLQLTATLAPEGAQSALKWKTSNGKIAKIDAKGKVVGVKPGACTVGVVTENRKTAKVKIKVVE